jgi:hypothetical protein
LHVRQPERTRPVVAKRRRIGRSGGGSESAGGFAVETGTIPRVTAAADVRIEAPPAMLLLLSIQESRVRQSQKVLVVVAVVVMLDLCPPFPLLLFVAR